MIAHVSTTAGHIVAVRVAPDDSIADVLARLPGPPPAGARLAVAGRPLASGAPAASLVGGLAAVHLPLRGGMTIKVKTLTGREIELDIEPSDKVERIKERLEEQEGIAPDQQRLIFSGKQLNDDRPVAEYGIEGGSVLHLVIALRGGAA